MLCQNCQPLILDSLYGLLDEPESAAVEAHLRECPACSLALAEAARLQGLLARAARSEYPQVRFAPPVATAGPAATASTTSVREPGPLVNMPVPSSTDAAGHSRPAAVWLAWAVAAAVLLAIPGTVLPVLGVIHRADVAQRATEESFAQAAVTATESERAVEELTAERKRGDGALLAAKQTRENLLASWAKEEKAVEQRHAAKRLTVEVHKPATAQPGAPNEFLLVLHEHDRGPSPNKRLLAEVRDQTDAVIYSQRLDPERREYAQVLRLPAEAWARLTPQSELFLVVAALDEKTGVKSELQEKVRLFGPVYATMLVTDRALYRPGDIVYFRSLTLDRVTFRPPQREQFLHYELHGPPPRPVIGRPEGGGTDLVRVVEDKVEPVLGPDGKPLRGVGCGAVLLPPDLPDGDYTLTLREQPHPAGYPQTIPSTVVRSFKVRSGTADVYAKRIDFAQASYSTGDTVEAIAELKFKNQPVPGAQLTAVATLDNGREIPLAGPPTDAEGRSRLRFALPKKIDQGDVRLRVTFHVPGRAEWVSERVPTIGRRVIVEFFPEGGPMVAGVPSRIYFRATAPNGQPVDIKGKVTDGKKVLAAVETVSDPNQSASNRGIGWFTFTPGLNVPAWLTLDVPTDAFAPVLDAPLPIAPADGAPAVASARTGFALPKSLSEGVVMSVDNPVTRPGEPFRVRLTSPDRQRNLVVGAYTRGRLSDTKRITTERGRPALVELMGGTDPRGGVVRITVFEDPFEPVAGPVEAKPDLKPVTERLVFRRPGEVLKLGFAATGAKSAEGSFVANSALDLAITATDEAGRPRPAVLWAAAVNAAVEPGKRDRLLTTHFLLAGEISTPDALEYADFLLTDQPRAAESLDLVLATQGWRRFVEQTPVRPTVQDLADFRAAADPDRLRLAAIDGVSAISTEQPAAHDHRALFERYWPRYQEAARALAAAQAAHDATDPAGAMRVRDLHAAADRARADARIAAENAQAARAPVERVRSAGWYGTAGFALLALMLAGMAAFRPPARVPYGVGTLGAIGLVAFLVSAIGMAERTEAAIRSSEEVAGKDVALPELPEPPGRPEPGKPDFREPGRKMAKAAPAPAAGQEKGGMTGVRPQTLPQRKDSAVEGLGLKGSPNVKVPPQGAGGLGAAKINPPGLPKGPPPVGILPGAPSSAGLPPGVPKSASLPPGVPELPGVPGRSAAGRVEATQGAAEGVPGGFGGRDNERDARAAGDALRGGLSRRSIPDWPEPPGFAALDEAQRKLNESLNITEEELRRSRELVREYAKRTADIGNVLRQVHADKSSKLPVTTGKPMPLMLSDEARMPDRGRPIPINHSPLVVREYAAPRPGAGSEALASDTILWQPVIVLPGDGMATLSFHLGAAKGGYQLTIAGHTLDGRIGAVRGFLPIAPASVPTAPVVPVTPNMP